MSRTVVVNLLGRPVEIIAEGCEEAIIIPPAESILKNISHAKVYYIVPPEALPGAGSNFLAPEEIDSAGRIISLVTPDAKHPSIELLTARCPQCGKRTPAYLWEVLKSEKMCVCPICGATLPTKERVELYYASDREKEYAITHRHLPGEKIVEINREAQIKDFQKRAAEEKRRFEEFLRNFKPRPKELRGRVVIFTDGTEVYVAPPFEESYIIARTTPSRKYTNEEFKAYIYLARKFAEERGLQD